MGQAGIARWGVMRINGDGVGKAPSTMSATK